MFNTSAARGTVAFCAALLALAPLGRAADALSYTKNYFVTGDYVVAGVGLRGTGVNGFATGTINVGGVPVGADIVAAFLYWQTVETTPVPSLANGFFDGQPIVGAVRGNPANPACWSSGGTTGPAGASGRVYRADVLRYLPVDSANSVRLANGAHTVKLPDSGGKGNGNAPFTNGASLVVVYRLLTPNAPLRAVVLYDGAFTLSKHGAAMTQTIAGFYQTEDDADAKMTQIVGNGQKGFSTSVTVGFERSDDDSFVGKLGARWDNPTFEVELDDDAASYRVSATTSDNQTCLTWSAIVTSTIVRDRDQDGLLDVWETRGLHLNPGTATTPATFGGCSDYPNEPCVNLPKMGASPTRKDIFIEIDWEHGTDGHLHIPKLDALNAIGATFANHGIATHFDVGNNYQTAGSPYILPAAYARGGDVIEESTLLCPNAGTKVCAFPGLPYSVQGWKIGYQAVKDGFAVLGIPAHFDHNRKDVFHYSLFAHALAVPHSPADGLPASTSGVADRPGGDLMITLGLWRSDVPGDDQTGSSLIQAGTLMHELGHNLGLSHAGLYRAPNCEPNYPSVMNYLYQTRGLTDAAGLSHIDYSNGVLPDLNESSLSETGLPARLLQYRVRFYGPPGPNNLGIAKAHCDGTPLTGDMAVRLEAPIGAFIDWNNNGKQDAGALAADVDFNGLTGDPVKDSVNPTLPASAHGKRWLVDTNDWANLNLRQIGARLNVAGLSADVGQTDLGQTDLGQTDLGQTDLGQTDLGQTDLGQTDLGQTDLGQTDLGDVDYDTVISTLDPTSPSQPLTASSSLTGITLSWGAPGIGQIRQYLIYRSDPVNTTPALIATVSVTPPVPATSTYTDTVDSVKTFYNTNYTYFVASVDINGTTSSPSNNASGIVDHLFIAANAASRVYGAANPAVFSFTTTGINPPGLAGTTSCATAALPTSNAGGYDIVCAGQTPALGITYTKGTLTITPAPLTINAAPSVKTYDGTTASAAVPAYSGTLFAQTVTGLAETFDSKNAGPRTLSVSPGYTVNDGNGGLNYTVTTNTANGTINPANASVTPNASGKVYGTADPVLTGTLTGFVAADGVSATYTRAPGSDAGVYTISATLSSSVAGALANYTVTSGTANFTITPAPQTIVFGPLQDMPFGSPDFAVSATASSGLPVTFTAVGSCTVTGSTVHLTASGNCMITAQQSGGGDYLPATSVSQSFSIKSGFSSVDFTTLTANGTGGVPVATPSQITMTTAATGEVSSAWLPASQTVGNGFTTQFQFQIGGSNTSTFADGFAFVIQNSGTSALGGGGGLLGYEGISNSLAIEFDTYQNGWDPNANHIAVQSNGTAPNSADHTTAAKLAIQPDLATTLSDGNLHTVKVTYSGTTLTVFLDGNQVLSTTVNLNTLLNLQPGGNALLGFTAGTGADDEQTVISGWSFSAN